MSTTPRVYLDGIQLNRRAVAAQEGDNKLVALEYSAFSDAFQNYPDKYSLTDMMFAAKACNGLGDVGALELLAKLGIFFALLSPRELYGQRR